MTIWKEVTPDPPALLDVTVRGGSYGMVPARRMGYGFMSRSVNDLDFIGFRVFLGFILSRTAR